MEQDLHTLHVRASYSTRVITLDEVSKLDDPAFADPDQWPVARIVGQRAVGRTLQYLVEWADHPSTGESFEPTWVSP
jgi:hypothetical protein